MHWQVVLRGNVLEIGPHRNDTIPLLQPESDVKTEFVLMRSTSYICRKDKRSPLRDC